MRKSSWLGGSGAVVGLLTLCGAAGAWAQDRIYGIGGTGAAPTSLSLFYFASNSPSAVTTVGTISGVTAGYSLVGMDFRPSTGELYALGYNSSAPVNAANAQLFVLNISTGVATARGSAFGIGSTSGSVSDSVGIGFNPSVDLLRVVTGTNGNYRVNPTTGALTADTGLAFASGDPNANNTFQIADADYTSNAALYNIDYVNNALAQQNPPNNGTLTTIGGLGITQRNGASSVGFDISQGGTAYLSTAVTGTTGVQEQLYTVSLANGATTLVGPIGGAATFNTIDIAVAVPEPGEWALLTSGGALLFGVQAMRRRQTAQVG